MTVRIPFFRREPEQPHPWFGRLRLGSRLRFGGKVYVLSEVSYGHGLRLEYQELGSWEASHLIDPHSRRAPRATGARPPAQSRTSTAGTATIRSMLIAAWVSAIAGAVLALSVPVAWFTWLSARKRDREQRERERQEQERTDLMKDASARIVSKDTLTGIGILGLIAAVLGAVSWLDSRKPKP